MTVGEFVVWFHLRQRKNQQEMMSSPLSRQARPVGTSACRFDSRKKILLGFFFFFFFFIFRECMSHPFIDEWHRWSHFLFGWCFRVSTANSAQQHTHTHTRAGLNSRNQQCTVFFLLHLIFPFLFKDVHGGKMDSSSIILNNIQYMMGLACASTKKKALNLGPDYYYQCETWWHRNTGNILAVI